MIQPLQLHPKKCKIRCGLYACGIIGYFFKNQAEEQVTVNGDRYRTMIINVDLEEMWFQKDGTMCHTANATIDVLRKQFDEKIISRNRPVKWPPRSCDLTPLDYFIWGYVKSLVYVDKPETIAVLKANITRTITDIGP